MPKRTIPEEYTSWINELPPEVQPLVRKQVENSVFADKIHHLHAGYTQATQDASRYKQQVEQAQPLVQWANNNQDWLGDEHLPRVVEEVRGRRMGRHPQPQNGNGNPGGRSAADISLDLAKVQRDLATVNTLLSKGEISWEDAQQAFPILNGALSHLTNELAVIPQRQQQLEQQVEELRTFQTRDVPQMIAAQHAENQKSEQRQALMGRESVFFSKDMVDYAKRHPARDLNRIVEEFKTGEYRSFQDAADALHGDEDRETDLNRRVEERYQRYQEEQAKTPQQNGEGAMGSYPMTTFQRPGREAPRAAAAEPTPAEAGKRPWHARSREAAVQRDMQRVLQNPDVELTP
jgi:hypothetical protein